MSITSILKILLDSEYNKSTNLIRMAKGEYEYITYKNIFRKIITKIKNI